MTNMFLEKKVDVLPDESIGMKAPIELEYYLIESLIKDIEDLNEKKAYGIQIVKKDTNGVEVEAVKNFSCCLESTKSVLNKLAVNSVTPVALPFVLDDILGI